MAHERGKKVEVYVEHGPIHVEVLTPAASVELADGVRMEERFFGSASSVGNFRLSCSKVVFSADEVEPAYELLRDTIEKFRLIWPFAGGGRLLAPLVSNHEQVYDQFLAERVQHRVSSSVSIPVCGSGAYSIMPLDRAASLLRQLGKLPGQQQALDRQKVLWLCVEWYEMATAAESSLDKFMKAFPPLDLLASTHHEETFQRADAVEQVRDRLAQVIAEHEHALPARVVEVLRSSLTDVGLRDKFEHFVRQKFPGEAGILTETFSKLNKARNALFHDARYELIDQGTAETARRLLWRSVLSELS